MSNSKGGAGTYEGLEGEGSFAVGAFFQKGKGEKGRTQIGVLRGAFGAWEGCLSQEKTMPHVTGTPVGVKGHRGE